MSAKFPAAGQYAVDYIPVAEWKYIFLVQNTKKYICPFASSRQLLE
jgi:hypothetical protein